jgi:O-antigen/teichoic acid export membrane protein
MRIWYFVQFANQPTGLFDVIAEFWPHVAIILYRMYPRDHNFLRKVFLAAGIVTFAGTILETIFVMYLWGWAWDRWTLAFKVVTPILHIIFSAAQVWGAYNFYKMWKKQKQLLKEQKLDIEEPPSTASTITHTVLVSKPSS